MKKFDSCIHLLYLYGFCLLCRINAISSPRELPEPYSIVCVYGRNAVCFTPLLGDSALSKWVWAGCEGRRNRALDAAYPKWGSGSVSQLPKINRTCATCIINTLICSLGITRRPARLHSALCGAGQEALNLAESTINRPGTQASFDFILFWLTGRNTLSFVQNKHFSFPACLLCCAVCVCGVCVACRRRGRCTGDSAQRDAGVLWFRYLHPARIHTDRRQCVMHSVRLRATLRSSRE